MYFVCTLYENCYPKQYIVLLLSFQAMIKSLEKNYRADLHKLALQLASILARKKDITPLNFGIHCLPEEILQVSKVMNNEEDEGGFQLEFVSISRVINHMTCYKFECSHWWKIYLLKILYKICSPV